jgi:hypothetical protein
VVVVVFAQVLQGTWEAVVLVGRRFLLTTRLQHALLV